MIVFKCMGDFKVPGGDEVYSNGILILDEHVNMKNNGDTLNLTGKLYHFPITSIEENDKKFIKDGILEFPTKDGKMILHNLNLDLVNDEFTLKNYEKCFISITLRQFPMAEGITHYWD